jgi:hypothetical protein
MQSHVCIHVLLLTHELNSAMDEAEPPQNSLALQQTSARPMQRPLGSLS